MDKVKNSLIYSNTDTAIVCSSISNTLLCEWDPISFEDDDIYSVVNDTPLGGTTTKLYTDTEQDHTYDTAGFHNQTHNNELPEYNTLQRRNAASIQVDSNSILDAYDKIDINTSKDLQKHSNLSKQLQRSTHIGLMQYVNDDVEINHAHNTVNEADRSNQTMPCDYEPVHHEPNCSQVDKPTIKQPV